mmetsp:Transcript_13401/g.42750  ORF Transcript_13401/g.42750 Transcript_13401/m.42750 type:complete len:183 (+) Transcript_13401:73-621(+)
MSSSEEVTVSAAETARTLEKPVMLNGTVVKGFGRGSKMLGIPTANIPAQPLERELEGMSTGIYAGWASVDGGEPYKAVLSIGWNPYFKNTEKTIEPHILHTFDEDFYGAHLAVCVTAYLRPECNFPSLEALIDGIRNDIEVARKLLDGEHHVSCRSRAVEVASTPSPSSVPVPEAASEAGAK